MRCKKKYIFPSPSYSFAVEIFVIAIVPRTCWVVQNHKIGASDVVHRPNKTDTMRLFLKYHGENMTGKMSPIQTTFWHQFN
jgi:hypothetical protein